MKNAPQDLNESVGGQYIYLCEHRQSGSDTDGQKCITDIQFVTGENAKPPLGYEIIRQDLNRGAGGEYIYLCYKLEDYDSERAIKDISFVKGDNPEIFPPYGYKKVPQDLNAGSGGLYIFLCYTTMV